MTDIVKHEGNDGLEKRPKTDSEIAEARKKFLVQKYFQKDVEVDLNSLIKFGVFKINIDQTGEDCNLELISKVDSMDEALEEIRWRAKFHSRPESNTDLAMQKDKRFENFNNETLHKIGGREVQHGESQYKSTNEYINHELDYTGNYIICPIYEIV